ncbi:MAG: DUF134 domain-containing protein [Spirochaetales bacterium]|nr:DUF134 domain-containing protein [Spirochaetales bacterium]
MSRPKKERIVHQPPLFADFKPAGIPSSNLQPELLGLDEFEAIRLADYLGMDHNEAAEEMEISRPTFTRLIEAARKKMATFIIEGKHLQIEGGKIHFRGNVIQCHNCGHMIKTRFNQNITKCPACGSDNLIDLAGGFGHGSCCRRHSHHGRR